MRIRSRLFAVVAAASLSVGGVLVSATAATAADDLVLEVSHTTFEAYDATWGGGIEFSSSGWTPGATVTVRLSVFASPSAGDGESTDVLADAQGDIAGTFTPTYAPQPPSGTGYPQYALDAFESAPGGIVNRTSVVGLTVEVGSAVPVPTIAVPNNRFEPGDTWGGGLLIEGTGWAPGGTATVVFVRVAADSTRDELRVGVATTILGTFTGFLTPGGVPAEQPDGDGYPRYFVYAEQEQNGEVVRSNEVALIVGTLGDPGGSDGAALPATGAADDALLAMGGSAAGIILLGLALVVLLHRRSVAGIPSREQ